MLKNTQYDTNDSKNWIISSLKTDDEFWLLYSEYMLKYFWHFKLMNFLRNQYNYNGDELKSFTKKL